ncbi:hypothetical protein CACET_c25770 [Clostridium aceticum]|uniref:Uncharacterized protein n=1 Tax=Clostridium aceticum TaxID=84022 RepID=A0A0D8IAJ2_9CLOT|nr:hypothetical protein [Clostridium aceticum]AKL96022.1 hypothetical protein CACET_c25770 [Clostridium aceticum]KJF27042.1 hypothetical protein TZ02_09550 [Clostridium aceticum]
MNKKAQYLQSLRSSLLEKNIAETDNILLEYESHIQDKVYQLMICGIDEKLALEQTIDEMPPTQEVAVLYSQEQYSISIPSFILLLVNVCIVIVGIFITISHISNFHNIHYLWKFMEESKWVLLISYSLIWLVIGYLYGYRNGFYQKSRFYQYTCLAVLPNYIFMVFILIGFQYGWTLRWFDFLDDSINFLVLCVILTLGYYPMTQLGHRIGVLRGI